MPPGKPTPADKALKREAHWANFIVGEMIWCLVWGALVLARVVEWTFLAGGGIVLVLSTLAWMLRAPAREAMGCLILAQMFAMDQLDQLLQRFLQRRAIRRRGSLGSGPTSDGSSGSTSLPRPDDGNGNE